jgi:hypothetical protein
LAQRPQGCGCASVSDPLYGNRRENGTTQAFNGVPAIEPLRFIWEVPGGGTFDPGAESSE